MHDNNRGITRMRIAVLGATGGTGLQVVVQALARSHQVVALVRNPQKFEPSLLQQTGFVAHRVDVFDADSLHVYFRDVEAVVSCLGAPRNWSNLRKCTLYSKSMQAILRAAHGAGVHQLIVVSSWCTQPSNDNPWYIEYFIKPLFIGDLIDDMARMEQVIHVEGGDLRVTVIRSPGLKDGPLSGKAVRTCDGFWVPHSSLTITRSDLAKFLLDCLHAPSYAGKFLAIGV